MKKSDKLKGKEKVQEKTAAQKRRVQIIGIVAVIVIVILGATAYISLYNPFVVAEVGDTVNVTYTGMFENKTVFQTNVNSTPLTFTIGSGKMIPGVDTAVRGMKVNEKKTVTIPSDQAYGAYDPALVQNISRSKFPTNQTITPGEMFYFQNSVTGGITMVTVVNVTSTNVTVDANSPLAGQNLTFDLQVTAIKKGTSTGNTTATS